MQVIARRERIARLPGMRNRIVGALAVAVGVILALAVILVPLEPEQQVIFALGGFVLFLVLNRFEGRTITIMLAILSTLISLRYFHWRVTETLEFEGFFQTFLGTGLVAAEAYAVIALMLSYFQLIWPLERKPVPLPDNPEDWPVVDIFIPTYNESLDVVRPTVFAAMAMDWPGHKMNVFILDDGRREEFRRFAAEVGCGYIIRPDNKGAKAGNINHALTQTDGEYVVVFDCDHVATRAFLQLTVGWMIRDRGLCMVQTPHHFYSPDPFERNLASGERVPNEGLLFYGLIQQGNDFWGGAFFCGSCAVIRRTALEAIGGVPTETVTEDCHASLRMQKQGWRTAYLRVPLAAGLATERLILHIGQRMRWARGMIQILRIENPLTARGLSLPQRLCYFMSMFHFLFPLPRFVFLTAPLAFLLFGENVIAASPLAIVAYAGPHIVHSIVTASRMQRQVRHSFWSEIYETVLTVYLLPVTLSTLLDPRRGKFNVTDKGGTLDEGYFDIRAVGPNMILAFALILGVIAGIYGMATNPPQSLNFQAYALNLVWAALCLLTVLAGLAVGRERRQLRERARISALVAARVILPDGRQVPGVTRDLSLGGAAFVMPRPEALGDNADVMIEFEVGTEVLRVPAEVLRWQDDRLQVRFTPRDIRDEGAIVQTVLGRADAWLEWDDTKEDRPLRSLSEVVRSIGGLFAGGSQFSLRRKRGGGGNQTPSGGAPAPGSAQAAAARAGVGTRQAVPAAIALGLLLAAGYAFAQPAPSARGQSPLGTAGSAPVGAPMGAGSTLLAPASGAGPAPLFGTDPNTAPVAPGSSRVETRTLRQLGLRGPMQLRGTTDLQGILFGIRGDEVVTDARLTLQGATSPALIPELSQIAFTLNEQFVGVVTPDRARPAFGPLEFPINPVFFADANRLNFRFTGRYAIECNDPLSGLLWSTISDTSTLSLTLERLPITKDLARLPEPFFDPRLLREPLNLPVVMADPAGNEALRAAAIVSGWFAVQADYRGAAFPVSSQIPARGNAVVISTGVDSIPGLTLPRLDGPTLAIVSNPNDPWGLLLVVAGRSGAEAVTAATVLGVGREALTGEIATVQPTSVPARQPYDAPRWVRTDRPVKFGELVDPSELQAFGYVPAPINIPFRTAPDLYTWRNRSLTANVAFRSPPGPITDVMVSRLDVSINDIYLRSLALAQPDDFWLVNWVRQRFTQPERGEERVGLPPYMLFGQNEMQLRFDMRPLHRGDCVAVPGDVRASVDPDSVIDLSDAYRFTTLPNLAHFISSGFPFTVNADLARTAVILPERPTAQELETFLTLMGRLAAIVGYPPVNLAIVRPNGLNEVAERDLIVLGPLERQPALASLLRDGPVQMENNRLTVATNSGFGNIRNLFGGERRSELDRVQAQLAQPGESLGALISFESPLRSGRSVVALTGSSATGVEAMLAAMRDPEQLQRIQGDLTLLAGGRVDSFRVGSTFDVGVLPPHLWPQRYLGGNPWALLLAILLAIILIAAPIYWVLRRRAHRRLRARTAPV